MAGTREHKTIQNNSTTITPEREKESSLSCQTAALDKRLDFPA